MTAINVYYGWHMVYRPGAVAGVLPPYAVELAARAMSAGKVVIYAGAGISLPAPTRLPNGAALARAIHARLEGSMTFSDGLDPSDLVALADEVAAMPGGEQALLRVSSQAADFQTATPGYTHRVLAHLMLEGVIDVLTTNWDTCIERSAGEESLASVVTDQDLQSLAPPSILKIHGCATRPDSLLVTSAHLNTPPQWVTEQTHSRLGSAVVIFLGIGDVAGYVKKRITEAVEQVDAVDHIRVVSPSIITQWDASQWSSVAPALSEEHKIGKTADEFIDTFAAAYVQACLKQHGAALQPDEDLSSAYARGADALNASDPLRILSWARHSDIKRRGGRSVLKSSEMGRALVALGFLVSDSAKLDARTQTISTDDGPIEVLIASDTALTRNLVDAAEARLVEYRSQDVSAPRFLISGGIGRVTRSSALPMDILESAEGTDVLNGPSTGFPEILVAEEVIAS